MDLRNATLWGQTLQNIRTGAIVVTCSIVGIVGSIMLMSYLFAAPYHAPYRPSCHGAGIKQVIDDTHNNGSEYSYTVVCNDGFVYQVR